MSSGKQEDVTEVSVIDLMKIFRESNLLDM